MKIRAMLLSVTIAMSGASTELMSGAVSAEVASKAQSNRQQDITELRSDFQVGLDAQHVDMAIKYMAKAIAPDDPAWNEKNPRWATVSALVGKHLHEDATVAFAGESAIAQSWEHAIGLSLSNNDIDTLLAFFRSDLGRRYLELQNAIDDLVIEERFRVATNGVGTASAAAAALRRRVLDLWMSVIMIRGTMAPHASATIVAMIYTSFDKHGLGPELELLSRRFSADLDGFEIFAKSAAVSAVLDTVRRMPNDSNASNTAEFFSSELKRHGQEWQAAYSSP
jgi:hypothetical protein